MDVKKCNVLAAEIRLETLKVIHSRGFGHVGGSMDLADLMAVLYGEVMKFDPKNPRWEDRDWLVLSKGHAGPVAYATFGLMGFYPMEEAYTLNQPHTKFPSHTDRKLTPGVDLTTGSLGQGCSIAVGMALGAKVQHKDCKVYTLLGDGECQEGQIWESFMAAAHYHLDNLTIIIDNNGLQIDGNIAKVMSPYPIDKKLEAFGFHVETIDGHDFDAIASALDTAKTVKGQPSAPAVPGKPKCILAHTVKGKGVSFMENQVGWHGKAPNEEQRQQALKELED